MMMMKRSLKIDFRVKDCSNKNYLIDEGFVPLGKIPSRTFIPDFQQLVERIDDIYALGEFIKEFDDSQLRILIGALYYSSRLAKFNLHFAQPVYFNVSTPHVEFVDCYCKGYVISASRKKYPNHIGEMTWDYWIQVISTLRGEDQVVWHLMPERVLTKEEFRKRKKHLIDEGKFRAPKSNLSIFQDWSSVIDENADAVELEDAPKGDISLEGLEERVLKEWKKKRKGRKGRKGRKRVDSTPDKIVFTD